MCNNQEHILFRMKYIVANYGSAIEIQVDAIPHNINLIYIAEINFISTNNFSTRKKENSQA